MAKQIPPGAEHAILLRGSDGKGKIGLHGFGAAIGLCYDGPRKDIPHVFLQYVNCSARL